MDKRKIIGLVLWGIAILAVIGTENRIEALTPAIIFFIIGLILIVKKSKSKEKQQNKENAKKLMEDKLKKFNAIHEAGLPVSNGTDCMVTYNEDSFIFTGAGNTFNLAFNKITDICIKTDTEIQKQYVSSIGGAVAGEVVFGPLGAIVGGRAKEKKIKTTNRYLIFTYLKDENIDYISFNITKNWAKIDTIINKFKKNNILAEAKVVEL